MDEKKQKHREASKKYYEKNKENLKEERRLYSAQYRQKNKEKVQEKNREHCKEYYHNNKDELKLKQKEYREFNKEKLKLLKKEDYENNKEKYKARSKKYRQENKLKTNLYKREYAQTARGRFLSIKKGAEIRDLSFELTFEEYEFLFFDKQCFYCGDLGSKGLDRQNNNLGYKLENCVCCCTQCNLMKLDYTLDEFYDKIEKIHSRKNWRNNI